MGLSTQSSVALESAAERYAAFLAGTRGNEDEDGNYIIAKFVSTLDIPDLD